MNVLTSQDVALIGCCPCQPDACEEPRKECQSITISGSCGFELPQLDCLDEAIGCKIYASRTSSVVTTTVAYINDLNYNKVSSESGTHEKKFKDGVCTQELTDYTFSDIQTESSEDGSYIFNRTFTGTMDDEKIFNWTETETTTIDGESTSSPPTTGSFAAGISVNVTPSFSCDGLTFIKTAVEPTGSGGTTTTVSTVSYADPVDAAFLEPQLMALSFDDDANGAECNSRINAEYFCAEPDPPLEGEDPLPVVECTNENAVCTKITGGVRSRYRMGIPAGARWEATTAEWLAWDAADIETRGDEPPKTTQDAAHAAWVIAHAAWTAADPDERGEEPLEPTPRSTYELQWDEVFFPEEWEIWKAAKDAFDAATVAHEIWTECEEDCGDEPVIPDDPGAEPTAPSLVASRSWVYAADEWSGWFEIAVPTEPGETRVVNMLVICYRSAALGQKPTAHGEVYEL